MEISREELEYAAGFFDGEGCIQINPKKSQPNTFLVEVRITNTNLEVLQWFKNNFGGSVGSQPPNKDVKECKPCWYWAVACRIANAFLKTIIPFLVIKREQAQIAIDFQSKIKRGCNRLTTEEVQIRRNMSLRVDALKEIQHLVQYGRLPSINYISGFCDGEGKIHIYVVRGYHELSITVTNTNHQILVLLKEAFGGAVIGKVERDVVRNLPCSDWLLQGDPAEVLMKEMLRRFICKRAQAELGIEFQKKKNELKQSEARLLDHQHLFRPYMQKIAALNKGSGGVPFDTPP